MPNSVIPAFRVFMQAASPLEKDELALLANTTKGQLYQLVSGNRNCGPDLAKRIEQGADLLRDERAKSRPDLPPLPPLARTDLCEACRECEYAKACAARA